MAAQTVGKPTNAKGPKDKAKDVATKADTDNTVAGEKKNKRKHAASNSVVIPDVDIDSISATKPPAKKKRIELRPSIEGEYCCIGLFMMLTHLLQCKLGRQFKNSLMPLLVRSRQ
jgi:hypothetical protein